MKTLFCIVIFACSSLYAFKVWFAGDGFRVEPVTGAAFEANAVYPDRLPAGFDASNPVWNNGSIHLKCGKNDVVAFQIFVDREADASLSSVNVTISDLALQGGNGGISRAKDISLFREWYVHVTTISEQKTFDYFHSLGAGWYADPLIPLDNASISSQFKQPLAIPNSNIGSTQRIQAFWVDIFVPPGDTAGEYTGTVTVSASGKSDIVTPISLQVSDFILPSQNHGMMVGMSYGILQPLVRSNPSAAHEYYKMAKLHRIQLEPTGQYPDEDASSILWTNSTFNYDNVMGPLFDGSLFTEAQGYYGPNIGMPVEEFTLPFNLLSNNRTSIACAFPKDTFYVPAAGVAPLANTVYAQRFQQDLREFEAHCNAKGWNRTKFTLFLNDFLDEPRGFNVWTKPNGQKRGGYNYIKWFGELIENAGLQNRNWVAFRNDYGDFKSVGEWISGWTVDSIFATVGAYNDIYNICASPKYVPTQQLSNYTQQHNQEWMLYYSCTSGEPAIPPALLDNETNSLAIWSWIAWRYGARGSVHWNIMDIGGTNGSGTNGWVDPLGYESATAWGSGPGEDCYGNYNGEAVLMYGGSYIGLSNKPVPSIRLKSARRGVEDYEYLWMLAAADQDHRRADSIAGIVIPHALDDGWEDWSTAQGQKGVWVHNPLKLDTIRNNLVDMLNGVRVDGTELRSQIQTHVRATAYPNPANPPITLSLTGTVRNASSKENFSVRIFDLRGRLIRDLSPQSHVWGNPAVQWDGKDQRGGRCLSGMYVARLSIGRQSWNTMVMILR